MIITIIAVATSGRGGTPSPAPNAPATAKTPAAGTDTQVAGIGTPARDGTFEFTVTAVTYAGKGGNQVPGKTAQGRYVLLHMTVKNICQVGRRPGKVGY